MNTFAERVVRFRYLIISVVVAITLLMGYFLKDIKVNADVMSYLMEDNESVRLFNKIGETFGGNDIIIVGLEGKDVFSADMLEITGRATDSILSIPEIGYVTSLTSMPDVRSTEFGIEIRPLVDQFNIPEGREYLDSLKAYILEDRALRGWLVSEDAKATLLIGRIKPDANRVEVTEMVQQKVESIPFEGNIFYGGMPLTLLELNRIIISDMFSIGPLAFILICLVLYAGFRNFQGVLLPMLTVVIATVWVMGLIALLGYKLTILTNAIPILLIALGNDYAIHVINAAEVEHRAEPYKAMQRAIRYIALPVILASVTTMTGFFSFIAGSRLILIREFAMFSIAGILFSLILTIVFVPAMMYVTNNNKKLAPKASENIFDKFADRLFNLSCNHQKLLIAFWTVVVIAGIFGITRITRSVDVVGYFRDNSIVKQGENILSEKFYGSNPLYIHFEGDMQSPEVLSKISQTQEYMQGFSYIPHSHSVADLISQLNFVLEGDMTIPTDKEKISQLWFLLDGQEIMEQLVSYDLQEGVIHGFVNRTDLEVLREIESNFDQYVKQHSGEGCRMAVTGTPVLLKFLDDNIVRSQVNSLIFAVIFVMLLTSLIMRSSKTGLLIVVPIGITLVALFGIMGITGVPIDVATVLCGSVTIGIGIDFSIHFASRYTEGIRLQLSERDSLERAVRTSGKSILISMASIIAGVAMMLFSNLVPLQRLGLLLAFTMFIAGVATLTLLPLLFAGRKIKEAGDVKETFIKE